MRASKFVIAGVIALALLPATAQAATAAHAPAIVSPAAQSLSLAHSSRVGAHLGKSSHILGLGLLASLLAAAGAVAAAVVVADAVDKGSSG